MLQKIPYGKFNSILHRSRIFSVYDDNKRILPTSTISIHLNALWLRTTESKVAKKSKGKKSSIRKQRTDERQTTIVQVIWELFTNQWLTSATILLDNDFHHFAIFDRFNYLFLSNYAWLLISLLAAYVSIHIRFVQLFSPRANATQNTSDIYRR